MRRRFGWFSRISRAHLLFRNVFKNRSNIIFYHQVWLGTDDDIHLDTGVSIEQFHNNMKTLRKYFEFVSLERMLSFNKEGSSTKLPLLALTFDDGFDLYAPGVSEVLADLGIPATTFVVTGCIGNGKLMWQHKLNTIYRHCGSATFLTQFNELSQLIGINQPISSFSERLSRWPMKKKEEYADELWRRCKMPPIEKYLDEVRPYFTWEGLELWIRNGNSVGFHTYSHPFCSQLDDQEIGEEIVDAADELGRRLGLPTHALAFSYPFGDRLPAAKEKALRDRVHFSCVLGVQGLSLRGTPPHQLERACVDRGIDGPVFGEPVRAFGWPLIHTRQFNSRARGELDSSNPMQ